MSLKRLNKELSIMPYPYHTDPQGTKYIITLITLIDDIPYDISMSIDTTVYPFRPPNNVTVNNSCYHKMLTLPLLYKTYKRCLCCETILCGDWTPTNKITDLVDEINKNIRRLHRARELVSGEVIKRRYLFPDAPLDIYL